MDDLSLYQLEIEFCPLLEVSLVSSVYRDFADSADRFRQTRDVLNSLRRLALEQQQGGSDLYNFCQSSRGSSSSKDDLNEETKFSVTDSLRGLELDELKSTGNGASSSEEETRIEDCESSSCTDSDDIGLPENSLREMFPDIPAFDISKALKDNCGCFENAVDFLLNHDYLEECITDGGKRLSKCRKRKRWRRIDVPNSDCSETSESFRPKTWDLVAEEIDFVSSKSRTRRGIVSSLYHASCGSVSKTIQKLLDREREQDVDGKNLSPTVQTNAMTLQEEVPSLSLSQAIGLAKLCGPEIAPARELAQSLVGKPCQQYSTEEIIPQFKSSKSSKAANKAGSTDFVNASSHKKSQSDPSTAGYYEDYHKTYLNLTAAEADALVNSQRSSTCLDLHGIGVKNALRITREKLNAWWQGMDEEKLYSRNRPGSAICYEIVTGRGLHSEGNISKLNPAIEKLLIREGWKFETGQGFFSVTGKKKAKKTGK